MAKYKKQPSIQKVGVYSKRSVKQKTVPYRRLELCSDNGVWIKNRKKERKKETEREKPGIVVIVIKKKKSLFPSPKTISWNGIYPKGEKTEKTMAFWRRAVSKGDIEKTPHALAMLMCYLKIANEKEEE
jgi:hypothetical protein